MELVDAALVIAGLALTITGAALGLRGCAHRGVRAWAVHLGTTAAMLAMLLPVDVTSSLGSTRDVPWPVVLAAALTWTVADGVRSRLRRTPDDAAGLAMVVLAGRRHARETVDLAAMTLLAVLMGTGADPTGAAEPPAIHAHAGTAPGVEPALVLLGWGVSLAVLAIERHAHDRWGLAGSAGMLGAMGLMALGHAAA